MPSNVLSSDENQKLITASISDAFGQFKIFRLKQAQLWFLHCIRMPILHSTYE